MATELVKLGEEMLGVFRVGVFRVGEVRVGLVFRTTSPVPVAEVAPVPPFPIGRTPNDREKTPVVVMVADVVPFTCKKPPPGTESPTEVTDPGGVCHVTVPAPFDVRTCPLVPVEFG